MLGAIATRADDATSYTVARVAATPHADIRWDGEFWGPINAITLTQFMGDRPEHFPTTQVKVAHDDDALHVIFRVQDRYVRTVAQDYNGKVYEDACVEFFFTPGEDLDEGYFNLETNAGGVALMNHQTTRGVDVRVIAPEDFAAVDIVTTLSRVNDPEITQPTTWLLAYRMPLDLLRKYADVQTPAAGVRWRANFYKVAVTNSHPHYLTWARVVHPTPNFHLPAYFGELVFQ